MQLLLSRPVGKNFVLLFLSTFICIINFADITAFKPTFHEGIPAITNISATRNRDRSVNLSWNAVNEFNIRSYEIQHSVDGKTFENIETVSPEGDETGHCLYNRTHDAVPDGDNYYRIMATDLKSKILYSAIVKVTLIKSDAAIRIYPNPVKNNVMQVQFTGQEQGTYQLTVTNKMGQLVYSTSIELYSSNVIEAIKFTHKIAPGTYQLNIYAAGMKNVQQIVVE